DDILVVPRVAGEHRNTSAILDAIAIAGFDHIAVVDLEGDHLHAALLIDRPVAVELGHVGRDARQRQLLVGDAYLDVVGIGTLEVFHQPLGAGRPDHLVWRLAGAEMRLQPAGEPDVRQARGVVGVIVRKKLHIDPTDRHLELGEPDGRAAAGVDQKFLIAGLDQCGRTEALRARDRHTGPEQRHAKVAAHCWTLMFASLTILVQRTISERTMVPNSSDAPPPGSTPSLVSASCTFSVLIALLTAAFSRAVTSGGVPAFNRRPAQSSLASFG